MKASPLSTTSFFIHLVLMGILAVIFWRYQSVDLFLAKHFYLGHGQFAWTSSYWANAARQLLYAVVWLVSLFSLLTLLTYPWLKKTKWPLPSRKALLYVICALIIVPTLVINTGFKDHFGRPRPRQVEQFSGTKLFQPAWSISHQCRTNCSFACGDAAVAYAFWMFLPFFRRRARKRFAVSIAVLGSFYGLIRMGQGGHFFSDVVFAWLITYVSLWLVAYAFYRGEKQPKFMA